MPPSLLSAGELLLPQDLDWTLVFVSFLNRYPSDTDNQIYSSSETRIWNHTLLVLILCTASFQILSLNFIMCSSMLCPLSFDSTLENFEFRWSIAGLILKALSLLLCFLLSAKCRITNQIIFSPVFNKDYNKEVYSEKCFHFFLGNCEVASILISVKVLIVQLSILAALRDRSPKKIFLLGKLFYLDWVIFLARGDTLLA